VEYKQDPYSLKKGEKQKNKVRRVKRGRLEICKDGKAHAHVPIPEWKLSGAETLSQAEPDWLEIWTEIPKKRDLGVPDHVVTEPTDPKEQESQGDRIRKEIFAAFTSCDPQSQCF
jgi:hypothetical protein